MEIIVIDCRSICNSKHRSLVGIWEKLWFANRKALMQLTLKITATGYQTNLQKKSSFPTLQPNQEGQDWDLQL